jgi:hypothetical protein
MSKQAPASMDAQPEMAQTLEDYLGMTRGDLVEAEGWFLRSRGIYFGCGNTGDEATQQKARQLLDEQMRLLSPEALVYLRREYPRHPWFRVEVPANDIV